MKHNTYEGYHDGQQTWYQCVLNGDPFNPKPSQKIHNHSPDGFSWGYSGSGPHQLALAILLEETDDPEFAQKHYTRFLREVVSRLDNHFKITSADLQPLLGSYSQTMLSSVRQRDVSYDPE